MKQLLVAATAMEIKNAASFIKRTKDWDALITGVGGVSTAYALMNAFTKQKPQIIIQAGIAGSFDKNILLGDVVVVSADAFGDLGVVENKSRKTIFDLNLIHQNAKPFKNSWLPNPNKKILQQLNLPLVKSVSVNEITTRKSDIDFYKNNLGASIESMEGAAFHYVCLMEKILFLQIRSISNYVGERNKTKWKMKEAIENLNQTIIELLPKLEI